MRETLDHLGGILNAVSDGVFLVDSDARLLRLNPAAEKLSGWSAGAASGRALAEVLCIETGGHPGNTAQAVAASLAAPSPRPPRGDTRLTPRHGSRMLIGGST